MKNTETLLLPESVLARWDAEDWDDERMIATCYRYEAMNAEYPQMRSSIELTEAEAALYTWGPAQDDITGGSQVGRLQGAR